MRSRIGDDQRPWTRERRHRAEIGCVTGGEDKSGVRPDELGQFDFEQFVFGGGAGDQTRARGARAPTAQSRRGTLDHIGVPHESEVIVRRQVDQRGVDRARTEFATQSGGPAVRFDGRQPIQRGVHFSDHT